MDVGSSQCGNEFHILLHEVAYNLQWISLQLFGLLTLPKICLVAVTNAAFIVWKSIICDGLHCT